jgi:hypothetical protein
MTSRSGFVLCCATGALLLGCGGEAGGPGASCGKVQPCGGDVVGAWNMVAVCEDPAAFQSAFAMQALPATARPRVCVTSA